MAGRLTPLSLQKKVTATLIAVMAAMVGLSYLALETTIAPAFDSLERSVAEINLVRAQRAIENDLGTLAATAGDWAPWDDAWSYVQGDNPGFEQSNLDLPTLQNLGLDFVLFTDARGKVVWRRLLRDGAPADFAELKFFDPGHPEFAKLLLHADPRSRIDGLIGTELGPMLVSSRPIVTSDNQGPIAGTIVMAQFLDAARQEKLRDRTEVALSWHPFDGESPVDVPLKHEITAAGGGFVHQVPNGSTIESYAMLPDLFGEPLLILRVDTPRQISSLGGSTMNGALMFLSAAGVMIALITWWLLRGSIVLPLERLAKHITGIRESGDLSRRLNKERGDEIGALASEFDLLTGELHDARRLLLEQSFKAGKADTAAEVLHNVRNAMTPLTNGIDRLSNSFRFAGSLRVGQAVAELADPGCPPERREKLLDYIAAAFDHIKETSDAAVHDLQTASAQSRQVEAILHDQEKYANVPPVVENLELGEIVEEAAQVIPSHEDSGVHVNLQQDLDRFRVSGHRIALQQVLGILIANAHDAIRHGNAGKGEIEISARFEDDVPMVLLSVRDTGCGFDEETRERVFQRGFTSKAGDSTGPGLHWCANAVAGMGGRVSAESDGPGLGAAFHVLLPAA